jgi:hypothetical protein
LLLLRGFSYLFRSVGHHFDNDVIEHARRVQPARDARLAEGAHLRGLTKKKRTLVSNEKHLFQKNCEDEAKRKEKKKHSSKKEEKPKKKNPRTKALRQIISFIKETNAYFFIKKKKSRAQPPPSHICAAEPLVDADAAKTVAAREGCREDEHVMANNAF